MYIINLHYTKNIEEVDALVDDHIEYLKKQYEKGIFIASGRKVPRTGGIILARAISLEELDQVIAEDPFHINGVAEYNITQFIPTMMAKGLEGLQDILPE